MSHLRIIFEFVVILFSDIDFRDVFILIDKSVVLTKQLFSFIVNLTFSHHSAHLGNIVCNHPQKAKELFQEVIYIYSSKFSSDINSSKTSCTRSFLFTFRPVLFVFERSTGTVMSSQYLK